MPLLVEWIERAIDDGVALPHAVTLSTVGLDGAANARTLIIKDLADDGVVFATRVDGAKAAELERVPQAAVTFYWREQGRQVRVRGSVRRKSEAIARADEQARPSHSRAAGRLGTQSAPLPSREEYVSRFHAELNRVATGDNEPSGLWAVYTVIPEAVEFWAATPSDGQIRLSYRREDARWVRSLLWP